MDERKLKKSDVIGMAIRYELERHRRGEITTEQVVDELRRMFLFLEDEARMEAFSNEAAGEGSPC